MGPFGRVGKAPFGRLSGGGGAGPVMIGSDARVTVGAYSFVVPDNALLVRAFGLAGGGGGGGDTGGAGGGSFEMTFRELAGATLAGNVGHGGGSSTNSNGTSGGNTTLNAPGFTQLLAYGGLFGINGTPRPPTLGRSGTGPAAAIYRKGGNGFGTDGATVADGTGEGLLGGLPGIYENTALPYYCGGGGAGPYGGQGQAYEDVVGPIGKPGPGGGGARKGPGGIGLIYIEYWGAAS